MSDIGGGGAVGFGEITYHEHFEPVVFGGVWRWRRTEEAVDLTELGEHFVLHA